MVGLFTGHVAGDGGSKVPVIGSQLLDLVLGIIWLHTSRFSGNRMLYPHLMDVEGGVLLSVGEGLEAAGQASHWLNSGTPTPVVLLSRKQKSEFSSAFY